MTPHPFPSMVGLLQSIYCIPNFPPTVLVCFFPPSPRTPSLPHPTCGLPFSPVQMFPVLRGLWTPASRASLSTAARCAEHGPHSCLQPRCGHPSPTRHIDLLSGPWYCLQIFIMALVMFSLALRVNVCLVHQTVSLLRAEVVLTISVTQNCPRGDAQELSDECLNTCFPALRNVTRCLT